MHKATTISLLLPFVFIFASCSDASDAAAPEEPAAPPSKGASAGVLLNETFDSFASPENWNENTTHGKWKNIFSGYGTTGVQTIANPWGKVLFEKPKASTSPGETHAALIISIPSLTINDFSMVAWVQTAEQLRRNSAPNAWECAWIIWHYRYESNFSKFYYIVPKPNGWEFGKTDPAYPGGQRFLRTGSTPKFPIKTWHKVKIEQTGNYISIWVNDVQLVNKFYDSERPYTYGSVGIYSEDAYVLADNIVVTSP